MNLLRSICCLFGGQCAVEEPKPTKETMRGEPSVSEGDLGQKEAELEKAGKDQMGRMEGGDATRKFGEEFQRIGKDGFDA